MSLFNLFIFGIYEILPIKVSTEKYHIIRSVMEDKGLRGKKECIHQEQCSRIAFLGHTPSHAAHSMQVPILSAETLPSTTS